MEVWMKSSTTVDWTHDGKKGQELFLIDIFLLLIESLCY